MTEILPADDEAAVSKTVNLLGKGDVEDATTN
jgi:hypothetical protein